MDVEKIACQQCGKVYSVPVWSKQPRCRVCGALLSLDKMREEMDPSQREEQERRAA